MSATRMFLSVALMVVAMSAYGQITARQGTPEDVGESQFKSPMIVDLPLVIGEEATWNGRQMHRLNGAALQKYVCDGIRFVEFMTGAKKKRNGPVKITFNFTLFNEPGIDKLASVVLTVRDGDDVLGTGVLNDIDIEEKQQVIRQITIEVRPEQLKAAKPSVTLTLRVKDNP